MVSKGIIHVHSTFSYDGQHSLEEIVQLGKARGYGFVGITEHSDTLDAEQVQQLVKECERLSSKEFILIPGIEFTCDNELHLIGLGIECYTPAKDPLRLVDFIREQGGISIIAHPSRYAYQIPAALGRTVNGIEVWNANYDGRFVPNDRSIQLWQEFRRHNSSLIASGGQDLHVITDHIHVSLAVRCEQLTGPHLLRAIREGQFVISNSFYHFRPAQPLGRFHQMAMSWARWAYLHAKALRR